MAMEEEEREQKKKKKNQQQQQQRRRRRQRQQQGTYQKQQQQQNKYYRITFPSKNKLYTWPETRTDGGPGQASRVLHGYYFSLVHQPS